MIPSMINVEDLPAVLDAFANDLANASLVSAFDELSPTLRQSFGDNFANTKGPNGQWPPHAPATIRIHGPHPLLILQGYLLQSVTVKGSVGSVEILEARSMSIGSTIFYAGWQNNGTDNGHIPARPFLWLDEIAVAAVLDRFATSTFNLLVGTNGT